MFGFGKAKKPRKQVYLLADGKMGTLPDNTPIRYAGFSNALVIEGTVWPPIIRDDSRHDNSELFVAIAEGLNNLGANRVILKRLRMMAADYQANKINATQVTDMVLRLVSAAKDIKVG
jgi:hypothetical protein